MSVTRKAAQTLDIFHLAILRAAVERKKQIGEYLGSWGQLNHWVRSTQALGLIDEKEKPTPLGIELASRLKLTEQSRGRAYLWDDASNLLSSARVLLQEPLTEE